jgi:hypothetical protein
MMISKFKSIAIFLKCTKIPILKSLVIQEESFKTYPGNSLGVQMQTTGKEER